MDAPCFDGTDAMNWISRVEYYFDHLLMPEAHRLHYVVMLFDPPTSEWVFNYRANNSFVTWPNFLDDVRHRFDPQCFCDYVGLLSKLVQTGSMVDYQATFEKYLNRVRGILESTIFSMFLAGLKPDMLERVEVCRLSSLAATMALVLELDARLSDRAQQQSSLFARRTWSQRQQQGATTFPPQSQPPNVITTQSGPLPGKASDRPKPTTIRVSSAEKAERTRLGLCWHCPEKWVIGHVCKQHLYLMPMKTRGRTFLLMNRHLTHWSNR